MRNKRPLVGVAILFGLGIWIGISLPVSARLFGIVTALFIVGFLACYRSRAHAWWFFPLVGLAGCFAIRSAVEVHAPNDLRHQFGETPEHARLRGMVVDWPETQPSGSTRTVFERTTFTLDVRAVQRARDWQSATGRVLVTFTEEEDEGVSLAYGDEIELAGTVERPATPRNPGQFDYRAYLARRGVHYQCRVSRAADIDVLRSGGGNRIKHLAATANEYFKKCLALGIEGESETIGLLWAITLGFRPGLTDEMAEPFMRTGTLHVFAVSGFHVAVVSAILVGALRLLRFSRRWSGLLSIPPLYIYTLITGAPASATRSFIMAGVVIFGYSLKRPHDIFNSLSAAAILVLLWNPQQLFDAGFQLSFFVVLAIALLSTRVNDALQRWAKPDPFLPWDVVPKWRRRLFRPLSKTLVFVSVSVAAVIGSAPLIASYFHLVTPIALISNLLIVLLAGGVISLGFVASLTGLALPWATECFNNANWLLVKFTLWLTDVFARIPLGHFYLPLPPWPLLAGYYLVAGALLSGWAWKTRARKSITFAAATLFVLATVTFYAWPRDATLTVLDVGGAQAVVFDDGRSAELLIDGGRRSHGEWVLRPFLRSQGIGRFDAVLLTVKDVAHAGGLIAVLDDFRFDRFYESTARSRSPEYRNLRARLDGFDHVEIIEAGRQINLADRARLRVLHPPAHSRLPTTHDNSVVFMLEVAGHRVLFKPVIGESVERQLVTEGAELECDVIVAGQHPREDSFCERFLDAAKPEMVILNVGSFPTYSYPRDTVLARLAAHGVRVLRTDECGAVTLTMAPGRLDVATFLPGGAGAEVPDQARP